MIALTILGRLFFLLLVFNDGLSHGKKSFTWFDNSAELAAIIPSATTTGRYSHHNETKITASNHDLKIKWNTSHSVRFIVQWSNQTEVLFVHFNENPAGHIAPIPDLTLPPFVQNYFDVQVHGDHAGESTLTLNVSTTNPLNSTGVNLRDAFVRITVYNYDALNVVSDVVGWVYFLAWSVSFYPQIYENWKRKSVIGLNFDFLGLNIVGFLLYSIFNIGLLWVKPIQIEYFNRHPTGVNPVQLNDVIFSLHAVFACLVTIIQCKKYECGNQSVSRLCKILLSGIGVFLFICLIVAISKAMEWIDFLYLCSYVKLFITLIKYAPQAYMNYLRKSTMGWSIGNILLDCTGGTLSMAQMVIIAYNNDDWSSIFGDPTKFGLGLFSVLFDVFFMWQHYFLYRNSLPHEELINDEEVGNEEDTNSLASRISQ